MASSSSGSYYQANNLVCAVKESTVQFLICAHVHEASLVLCLCVCLLAVPTYNKVPSGSEGREQGAVRSRKTAKTRSSQKKTLSDTNSKQMGRKVLGSAGTVSWGFSTNFLFPARERGKKRQGTGRKCMAHLKHNQSDFLARLHKRTEIIILKLKAATPCCSTLMVDHQSLLPFTDLYVSLLPDCFQHSTFWQQPFSLS